MALAVLDVFLCCIICALLGGWPSYFIHVISPFTTFCWITSASSSEEHPYKRMYKINFTGHGMRQVNSHEGDDGRPCPICMQLWKSSFGITAMWTFLWSQLYRALVTKLDIENIYWEWNV
jgi:hypothetical protein